MLQVTQLGTKDAKRNETQALCWKNPQTMAGNFKILLVKAMRGLQFESASRQATLKYAKTIKFFPLSENLPFKSRSHF